MIKHKYEIIIFWSEEDQSFIAEVPELAGCIADGETYQTALQNAEQIIGDWIETAISLGRSIPEPKGNSDMPDDRKRLKMMNRIVYIFILSLIPVLSNAQDVNNQLWEKANAAYLSQKYQESVDGYEQILRTGHESAKLYFNLGNAYYKTGQTNLAILYLERAKLLDPNNDDIDFNLAFVNQHVVTKLEPLPQPFFVRWRASILNMHTTDTWAIISLSSFILFLLLAGFFIFSKVVMVRRISFISGIIFLVFSVFTFSFAGKQKKKIIQRNSAIVFCPRVTVKSAPTATSTDLFLIYEGVKVELTDSIGSWKEIKLADGNEGWLKDSCIVKI